MTTHFKIFSPATFPQTKKHKILAFLDFGSSLEEYLLFVQIPSKYAFFLKIHLSDFVKIHLSDFVRHNALSPIRDIIQNLQKRPHKKVKQHSCKVEAYFYDTIQSRECRELGQPCIHKLRNPTPRFHNFVKNFPMTKQYKLLTL